MSEDKEFWEFIVNQKLQAISRLSADMLASQNIHESFKRHLEGERDWYLLQKVHGNHNDFAGSISTVQYMHDSSLAVRSLTGPLKEFDPSVPYEIPADMIPLVAVNQVFANALLHFHNTAMTMVTILYSPERTDALLREAQRQMDEGYAGLRNVFTRIPKDLQGSEIMQKASAIKLIATQELTPAYAHEALSAEDALERVKQMGGHSAG